MFLPCAACGHVQEVAPGPQGGLLPELAWQELSILEGGTPSAVCVCVCVWGGGLQSSFPSRMRAWAGFLATAFDILAGQVSKCHENHFCTALKPQFFKVFACLSFMYLLLHCVLARLLGKKGAIPSDGHQVADSAVL